MHWFIDPIRDHYVDFEGRVARQTFWYFTLIAWVISLILSNISDALGGIFSLAILLPSLGIGARRLHDTNRSGWWQLLWLIPVVGWIIIIVFLATDSYPADNAYGPNPKASVPVTPITPDPTPIQ